MSNSLNHDLARRFVMPDLGPNCLQRLLVGRELMLASRLQQTTNYVIYFLFCVEIMLTILSINLIAKELKHI